jgi:hypothetical protein
MNSCVGETRPSLNSSRGETTPPAATIDSNAVAPSRAGTPTGASCSAGSGRRAASSAARALLLDDRRDGRARDGRPAEVVDVDLDAALGERRLPAADRLVEIEV